MASILKFAPRSELQNQPPASADADISRMVTNVFRAQQAAKGCIVVALFEMGLTLVRCRAAIERIPESSPEKQRFEYHLSAIECAMMVAKAVAARF
jgi:hypothetical protein